VGRCTIPLVFVNTAIPTLLLFLIIIVAEMCGCVLKALQKKKNLLSAPAKSDHPSQLRAATPLASSP
jgi:hypothetical protein